MKTAWYTAAAMSFFAATANAQQGTFMAETDSITPLSEVVVSDSRFPLKRSASGKTVIRLEGKALEQERGKTLAQVLNAQLGIEINGSRSNGAQNLSYFIRGGNNRQVLFVIDGVQMNDPSQIASDFDLRLVDLSQVASIEILKGASSTLYGNAAAAAVIVIETLKPSDASMQTRVSSSLGTMRTANQEGTDIAEFSNQVHVSGSASRWTYGAQFAQQYSDGFSAVEGDERDAFSRYNLTARAGYKNHKGFSANFITYYDRFRADFDNTFPVGDAPFFSRSEQVRFAAQPRFVYAKGDLNLHAAYNRIQREIDSDFPVTYQGNSLVLDLFNRWKWGSEWMFIGGINLIQSQTAFEEDTDFLITDPYVNFVWMPSERFRLNAGVRLNIHSEYGENLSYNFNPSYDLLSGDTTLKLFGSLSSSYIAPSLAQLFGPFGANPELRPETNTTWEQGVTVTTKSIAFSALFFKRFEEDFIEYRVVDPVTFEAIYANAEQDFSAQGVEADLRFPLNNTVQVSLNYAFTENPDRVVLRIPKHKANASVGWQINEKLNSQLQWQYTGARLDTDFTTFENRELEAFQIFSLQANYKWTNRFSIGVLAENLLDEEYTEVIGFQTRGRNLRLTMSLTL